MTSGSKRLTPQGNEALETCPFCGRLNSPRDCDACEHYVNTAAGESSSACLALEEEWSSFCALREQMEHAHESSARALLQTIADESRIAQDYLSIPARADGLGWKDALAELVGLRAGVPLASGTPSPEDAPGDYCAAPARIREAAECFRILTEKGQEAHEFTPSGSEATEICPICGRRNCPGADDACAHFVALVWDGDLVWSDCTAEFEKAWDEYSSIRDDITELVGDEASGLIDRVARGLHLGDTGVGIKDGNLCYAREAFETLIEDLHVGQTIETSGMLSGSGYTLYLEEPARIAGVTEAYRQLARGCKELLLELGALSEARAGEADDLVADEENVSTLQASVEEIHGRRALVCIDPRYPRIRRIVRYLDDADDNLAGPVIITGVRKPK